MDAILEETKFEDFGEDSLFPFASPGLRSIETDSKQPADELKRQVRKYVPREPGVYGMLDPRGRLVYIGKSKSLRNRLLSYFLPNSEEDKAGRIVQSTRTIVWEPQPSDFAALLREQFLIRRFQPRFNVQGIPRRQQAVYICLGRPPAEHFYTSKQRDPKASYVLGPLAGASRAGRAVEVLNRLYRLRDCTSSQPCSFTDQMQLFDLEPRPGCIRLEIQSCLGPCISACSKGEYENQVENGRSFLTGSSDSPIVQLEQLMAQAAKNLHFEQARILRDDLACVRWLARRAEDMARARAQYNFVYPVDSHGRAGGQQTIWYLIRNGMIEGAMARPRNLAERKEAKQTIRAWHRNSNLLGSPFVARPETLALVTSWFKKHRGELKHTFSPSDRAFARKLEARAISGTDAAPSTRLGQLPR